MALSPVLEPVSEMIRWQYLTAQRSNLDITQICHPTQTSNLQINYFNLGGCSMIKLTDLCWVFLRSRHDVLYILDTRQMKQEGKQWIRNMREILPARTWIRQIPVVDQTTPIPTKARRRNQLRSTRAQQQDHTETLRIADNVLAQVRCPHPRVGGMIVLVNHR
jgi:hypothetical protein